MTTGFQVPDTNDYTFSNWLESTRQLQEVAYGHHYELMPSEERADSMMMNMFAAVCEIVEMGQECGWKPWAKPRGWINRDAVIKEAVDLMHFAANMLTHANCTGEELTAAYKLKQVENLRRQVEGYDGVAGKCPGCKRELKDVRVNTHLAASAGTTRRVVYSCAGCGKVLHDYKPPVSA